MANIVVLEDERIVKNLVTLVLRQHRHSVWQAATPEEAEQICKEHFIDLVVADVNLAAGRSGTDFALQLVQAKPKIRFVFISGLPFEDWTETDERNVGRMTEGSYTILCKPLSPATLLKAIDHLLPKFEPIKAKRFRHVVPAGLSDPWLKTMRDLLTGIQGWLEKGDDDCESWNLYTATAHVCLEEMKAVVAGKANDELGEFLKLVTPHVEVSLQALQARDRQAALTSLSDALSVLSED